MTAYFTVFRSQTDGFAHMWYCDPDLSNCQELDVTPFDPDNVWAGYAAEWQSEVRDHESDVFGSSSAHVVFSSQQIRRASDYTWQQITATMNVLGSYPCDFYKNQFNDKSSFETWTQPIDRHNNDC